MNFAEKRSAAFKLLEERSVPRRTQDTYYHRFFWRLGVEVPPPLSASVVQNSLVTFVGFTPVFAVLLQIATWLGALPPADGTTYISIVILGVVVSILMSFIYRLAARKYKVPSWRDFDPAQAVPPAT